MNILKIEKDSNKFFSILFALFYNKKKLKFANKDVLDWKVAVFARLEMIVQNKKQKSDFLSDSWLQNSKKSQFWFCTQGPQIYSLLFGQ